MTPDWIIATKRDGKELSRAEIDWAIAHFRTGEFRDYQMAALAMAIYLRGMSAEETTALTQAMLASGSRLTWHDLPGPVVDKHSTGGVGDKVSIVLAPLLACCGLYVPMLSGRGLGATGGTLDKLESIPGLRTDLQLSEVQSVVRQVGCVITGTTPEIAPADRELYALRDVTATVASIPLITASIMSKKLAEGLSHLVLDVKHGSGAFMKNMTEARRLAQSLLSVGAQMQVPTSAVITDMNQPLGEQVGNALEVNEAVSILQNAGPADVRQITLAMARHLLLVTGLASDALQAENQLQEVLASGAAYAKLEQMVAAQGGDLSAQRPLAPPHVVTSDRTGYLHAIDTELIGRAVIAMGGGRQVKGAAIDTSVGLTMHVRVGSHLAPHQPLVTLHAPKPVRDQAERLVHQALQITDSPPTSLPTLIAEWHTTSLPNGSPASSCGTYPS